MTKRLTYEQRVLKVRRDATCELTLGGKWAIWLPSIRYDVRLSAPSTRPHDAWRSAWRHLKGRK